ncbi:KTSC domain-containing protein [Wohlfahrtiimonas chitiniclastica]|uniref:KTSC domain-containing protein n=1 Tax=Wohlfahrtiimonas chitiniclastica TaxID=400946 RepID=UPI001BCD2BD3|nr:KTSC domain-containing protein [Wohlfahrtiimonas chitiniclastica]
MIYQPVSSSNVASIAYDENSATLGVKFHSGGTYHYFQVPPAVHANFLNAGSKGTFLHNHIKGHYRYMKV